MATETKKCYWGTGRRKTAVARVRLYSGSGKVMVNDRPVDQYFTETENRNQVFRPLEVAELLGKMDVFVNVHGGGYNGQAGAVMQGLARAIKTMVEGAAPIVAPAPAPTEEGAAPAVPAAPAEVKRMRDAGLLTRDARMKERKKYGRRGARRSFQFSKR